MERGRTIQPHVQRMSGPSYQLLTDAAGQRGLGNDGGRMARVGWSGEERALSPSRRRSLVALAVPRPELPYALERRT